MSLTQFQRKISKYLDVTLDLRINDNRSTMLHVLERRRGMARLSLHRKFLEAPEEVIAALAYYVKGTVRPHHEAHRVLRRFIQNECVSCDVRQRVDVSSLETEGEVYSLQPIFNRLNARYFDGELTCSITWYGQLRPRSARPRKITFGLYYDSLKLIKIHRLLDDPFFPPYFVEYVVYHEMVHNVIPGETDARGYFRVHTARFKERERQFVDYDKAMHWEHNHKEQIFRHGRT